MTGRPASEAAIARARESARRRGGGGTDAFLRGPIAEAAKER